MQVARRHSKAGVGQIHVHDGLSIHCDEVYFHIVIQVMQIGGGAIEIMKDLAARQLEI